MNPMAQILPFVIGGFSPGIYQRDIPFAAKAVSVAADRSILLTPNRLAVDVAGSILALTSQDALDLSLAATWDSTSPADYTVAANRAGKDFSVYACLVGGVALKLVVSANATTPIGYTALTSRRVAGFHCLCVAVGTISGHPLSGYLPGEILPASVWDLKFRPVAAPEGMVYVAGIGRWVDIYLASVSGGALVSVNGGTIADGTSSVAFHWYKFSQWLGSIGKWMPTQHEFVAASLGANQGTSISGTADPVTTGGHVDTAGRRMISNVGCEDTCGAMWQVGMDAGSAVTGASFLDAYDANDSGVAGQHYAESSHIILGGSYASGVTSGSRGSVWGTSPLALNAVHGARGISDTLAVGA